MPENATVLMRATKVLLLARTPGTLWERRRECQQRLPGLSGAGLYGAERAKGFRIVEEALLRALAAAAPGQGDALAMTAPLCAAEPLIPRSSAAAPPARRDECAGVLAFCEERQTLSGPDSAR
jgi:hypothetical protein